MVAGHIKTNSMKILITGSNGLLGQKLTTHLLTDPGVTTIATGRGNNRIKGLPAHVIYESMDITDAIQINLIFQKHQPDAVIHTAALTQVDECELNRELCWQLNVGAVQHIVNACEKYNVFLLHLSTDFIFDGKQGPYGEQDPPNPISYYGESKLAAEKIVASGKMRWAIARTVLVYGIAQDMSRSNIILWVKDNLEKGNKIKVVNDQWRTPTLAEDLAMGCIQIVKGKNEGIFNLSGKDFLTPYEMAIHTADFFKLDKSLIEMADASTFSQPAKRPPKTGFTIDKAIKHLGYSPHSFDEGIAIVAQQLEKQFRE